MILFRARYSEVTMINHTEQVIKYLFQFLSLTPELIIFARVCKRFHSLVSIQEQISNFRSGFRTFFINNSIGVSDLLSSHPPIIKIIHDSEIVFTDQHPSEIITYSTIFTGIYNSKEVKVFRYNSSIYSHDDVFNLWRYFFYCLHTR